MAFVWWKPWPFTPGEHTRAICDRLTQAVNDYLAGHSSRLRIAVPYRHGKTDMASRAFPAYFLGRCRAAGRDPDTILTGYGADLVEGYSRDCKAIIRSAAYQELFPGVTIPRGENSVQSWKVAAATGRATAVGLGGALIGRGGDLIVVDDYCKNRAEARSAQYRRRTWESFQDTLTRAAPVSITLLVATPWNVDDVHGRIVAAMKADPDFPRFDVLKFPARRPDGGFLFPERYSAEWYVAQYAAQGRLAAALLDCDPVVDGGNRFDVDKIVFHDKLDEFPKVRYRRAWDLASSEKQRDKDDPDYTVGIRGAVTTTRSTIDKQTWATHDLWIADLVYCRAEAPARDQLIRNTVAADGQSVAQVVEAFGAYKDAYTTLKAILKGFCLVEKSVLPGDKSAKAAPLEPIFDAGRVHVLRAPWNEILVRHFREFPDGAHDDAVDAAAVLYHAETKPVAGIADPSFYR